ncbi:MAG: hypothetical protein ACJZ0Y_00045 [Cytophagales bacterium]|jgi:hypothetical protein|nr:MAG: hypothetical protein CND83_01790 [Rhodothermaeota bacterium MED-G19]
MRIKNPLSLISQPKIFLYCLLVGSLIWVFNELNNRTNVTIFYPINFQYDNPESLVILEPIPDFVEISINGTGWNLLRNLLKINIREAEYKLNNPAQTKYLLSSSLIPNISESLEKIGLNYVVTDSVFFNIELKKTKSLILKLDESTIKLRDNFKVVSDITISDDSIHINGPESLINNLPDEYLVEIKENNINRDFNSNIRIEPFDDFSEISPNSIRVSFLVSEFVNDEINLNLKYTQDEYNIDTTVLVTYQIEKGLELSDEDSLYLSYELINGSVIPKVVGTSKIEIIDLTPNSIKLDR